jgi:quinol monooxygenase YgiN
MSTMIFHTAHLRVRPDALETFRERVLRHASTCLNAEPGCHRFDIYQETENSTLFLLIEILAQKTMRGATARESASRLDQKIRLTPGRC